MVKQPAVVCIIPARGGSKGIPNKNLVPFLGKPLLAHSIEQARESSAVQRVIVSTDSEAIADVARHYGATVITRPSELSTDTASSESALLHALDTLEQTEQYIPDLVVFLQSTSPLRSVQAIDEAIETLQKQEADSLFSACVFKNLIWEMASERVKSLNFDYTSRLRRQEWPKQIMENGSLYIVKTAILRRYQNRLGGKIAVYLMDYFDSFQIDEPEDIALLESIHLIRGGAHVTSH